MNDRIFLLVPTVLMAWVFVSASSQSAPPAEKPVDFNRDIRPLLYNNCISCHGPDENARKAELRLDTEEGAYAAVDGHAAIVKGKPEASELVKRITSTDASEKMPPVKSGKMLSAADIELLQRWIRQGAKYQKHWAYEIPKRHALPEVKDADTVRTPIDNFILSQLQAEGLRLSPETDRYTLARRVALDLTGLPPMLAEADSFANDKRPDAYERFVNAMLAKPAYGEHAARLWLDLARYADSAGYANDPARTIWLYRDYVIKSFNSNKPFDQFTIEQMAGDLLPNPTEEQLIATAFHRNTLTNSEGGTSRAEFRNAAVVDRVNTTMNVWMGTSMACAQCHTHKYDPISHREYFQFLAFLNNTADADRADEKPVLAVYTPEQKKMREPLLRELTAIEQKMKSRSVAVLERGAKWEAAIPATPKWTVLKPKHVATSLDMASVIRKDDSIFVPETIAKDTFKIELTMPSKPFTGLQLETLTDQKLPGQGPGHNDGNFIVTNISLAFVPLDSGPAIPIPISAAIADRERPNYEAKTVLIDRKQKPNGWSPGQPGVASRLTLVLKKGMTIPENVKLLLTIEHRSTEFNSTLGLFRIAVAEGKNIAETAAIPTEVLAALAVPAAKRTKAQNTTISNHYVQRVDAEFAADTKQSAALTRKLDAIKPDTVPVMKELAAKDRRKTNIQLRGNYLDLGEAVTEGVPAVLHPLPKDAPRDRLTLARWLVSQDNPLTPRVIANRYWEQFFGHGLVRTSEEFGSQGDTPSHPELLDWLATELIRLKWDTKAFVKMIVMSATYRQSSAVSKAAFERDADNRLLSRGPRLRLTAEMVRDQSLSAGGLLSAKMYGPSVRPPQPELGINAAFGGSIDWKTSEGEDRYRRGLYTVWRRSNPYPSMSTFDAPNRDICIVRRNHTNTPLQALVTLNDVVYIEAAQSLARLTVKDGGETTADKVRFAFRRCLTRPARDEEVKRLVTLFEETQADYAKDPSKAKTMATVPLGAVPAGMNAVDLAAWTVVGNVLLNLDEALMKR
ncbi:PSD1 and planctomycete cytochrome C domain-containing protein [soil metagenome]